jgi:chorismate mutase
LRFIFITVSDFRLPVVKLNLWAEGNLYLQRASQTARSFYIKEKSMTIRGIRGATTVDDDQVDQILAATQELLEAIITTNPAVHPGEVASAFFTVTDDLFAVHPALAARRMGWNMVPMMCAREIPVPGSLPRCIRVLLHWNTEVEQKDIKHVYLHKAVSLRPDLING